MNKATCFGKLVVMMGVDTFIIELKRKPVSNMFLVKFTENKS